MQSFPHDNVLLLVLDRLERRAERPDFALYWCGVACEGRIVRLGQLDAEPGRSTSLPSSSTYITP